MKKLPYSSFNPRNEFLIEYIIIIYLNLKSDYYITFISNSY